MGIISDLQSYRTDCSAKSKSATEWKDYISEVYFDLDVALGHNDGIRGAIKKRTFADVGISSYAGTPHGTRRTKASIQKDLIEQHVFVLPVAGRFECRQNGHELTAAPGSMYVLNGAEPYAVDMYDGAEMVAISLPCTVTRLLFAGIDDKCCKPQIGDPILIATLVAFIQNALSADSKVDTNWLRDVSCDLLGKALSPVYNDPFERKAPDAAHLMLLDMAREAICTHLHDQNFEIADTAATCRVSKRHLQDIFQKAGTTFTKELMEARLTRAAEALTAQSRGSKRIGQIAYECGFRSQSYFSSLYRSRFGRSPRDETIA